MDLEQWYKTYAKYKWEFLRRNPDYQKDFDEITGNENYEEVNLNPYREDVSVKEKEIFGDKWKLPIPLNYRYSIDEMISKSVVGSFVSLVIATETHLWAMGKDPSMSSMDVIEIMGKYDELLLPELIIPRGEYYGPFPGPDFSGTKEKKREVSEFHERLIREFIKQYKKDRDLTLKFDLGYKKEIILHEIKKLLTFIEQAKRHLPPEKPPSRKRQVFNLYPLYLTVWDMSQKGLPFPDIASEVFPEDFVDPTELEEGDPEPNPDNALAKVHQYYKEADRMIKSGI